VNLLLNLKLRDLHVSNTLGCVGDWNTLKTYDRDEVNRQEVSECDG
jgi:hypothetical protein